MTRVKKNRNIDMTSGPIFSKIVVFAIPFILMNILQLFFNAADQIVVGQFAGTESLAAVGSTGPLVSLIVNLFIGLSTGVNVVIAKAIGERNEEKASRATHTGILLGLVCGIVVSTVGLLFSRSLLSLINCDGEVIDKASLYLRVYFLGSPAMLVYNFGASILRSKGDTRRPLIFLTLSGIMNVLLNLLFVISFKLDVAGVALATIISQYASAFLVLFCLFRERDFSRLSIKKLRFYKDELVFILRIGIPAGISSSTFSISNVIIQSALNSLGKIAMAGNTAAAGLNGFGVIVGDSIAISAMTFVGQNYGAKRFDRVRKINLISFALVTGIAIFFAVFFLSLARPLASLYSTDKAVIECSVEIMLIIMPFTFLCSTMSVFNCTLRGIGYSSVPMIISLICVCGVRIVWVYTVFALKSTLTILFVVQPISWGLTTIANFIVYLVLIKRREKQVMAKEQETEQKTA